MTKKTKLEIIGEYREDHPGPFCTRDGRPVRIVCRDMENDYPIVAVVLAENGKEFVDSFLDSGAISKSGRQQKSDLMCAREVPVAREFWVNEYTYGVSVRLHLTEESAAEWGVGAAFIRTIHVREVLPGEGA